MKIAVNAASGGLGSAITRQLLEMTEKKNIIGLARSPEKAKQLGIEIRNGDYTNKEGLIKSLAGIDAVLLVSGNDAPEKRIGQHRNVIEAAKQAGVKKIVYTSIFGEVGDTSFSPIIASNRQTEEDIKNSGLDWVIGRNGLYIEADVEYIETYKIEGRIANCAGEGKCSYTTRDELGYAYAKMLLEDKHNGNTYNLAGEAITQQQLADFLNDTFNTQLVYESMTIEAYQQERQKELGEFLGTIIAGIYAGIRNGRSNVESHYKQAAGREHVSWQEYFQAINQKINN
jgi:NAD(P)H dehydrogenase (quinone)